MIRLTIAPLRPEHYHDNSILQTLNKISEGMQDGLRRYGIETTVLYDDTVQDKIEKIKQIKPNLSIGLCFEESGIPSRDYGITLRTGVNGGLAELAAGYLARALRQCHSELDRAWTPAQYRGVYEAAVRYRYGRFLREPRVPSVCITLGHAANALDRYFYHKFGTDAAEYLTGGVKEFCNSVIFRAMLNATPKKLNVISRDAV